MGQKSRAKQARRTAAFEVLSRGMLEVLSVGKGDLKIEIGNSNADRAKAQRLIEDMLRKGYTLFVETADGPLRVRKFLPDEMAYLVADVPDVVAAGPDQGEPPAGEVPLRAARGRPRKVPVAGSKTTAIGRTAGG